MIRKGFRGELPGAAENVPARSRSKIASRAKLVFTCQKERRV
jgi:hypothetical protein